MKRRQESFAFLWVEMCDTLFKRAETVWPDGGGSEYLRYDHTGLVHGLSTSGDSDNMPLMAASVRYHRFGLIANTFRAFFAESLSKWMGSEVDSTIYDSGHVCAVLLVAERAGRDGQLDLYAAAMDWLEYYGARALARFSPRAGRVLAIGQRSAGHNYFPMFADDYLRVARGWNPPPGWKTDGRDKTFLWAFKDLVRASMEDFHGFGTGVRDVYDYLLHCGRTAKTALHVYVTPRGMAAWHDPALIDGATQPVPAAIEIDGKVEFLPPNRADGHDRSRADGPCTVTRTADSLIYDSAVYGRHEKPLPPGEASIDVVVGLPLVQPPVVVPEPTSEPDPAPVPPKKENKWTGWL